jgi:hypothetical protein
MAPRNCSADLDRFIFLLGDDDGEALFGPGAAQ